MLGVSLQAQMEFSGFYQNWMAVRAAEENDIMLIRNRVRLDGNLYGETVGGYFSIDIRNDGTSGEYDFETSFREAYVDLFFSNVEFRLGKQQVVWGKADGVFINDIVCPLDMSMFLLQDFDNIRMGLPMAKANLYLGNWMLEGLWIPKFEPWQFAEAGSDWEFTLSVPPDTVWDLIPNVIHLNDEELPENSLENSEFGLKLSTFLLGADISLLYLDGYADHPSIQVVDTTITGSPIPTQIDTYLSPTYYRSPMYGLNFSRPVFTTVIRGELGYFGDRRFSNVNMQNFTSDYFSGMMGLDFTGPLGSSISFQAIHRQIMDYKSGMVDDKTEQMATATISGSFLRETVIASVLGLADVNEDAGLGRLDISYAWSDALRISLGGFLLWGNEDTLFGQFDVNDNIYLKIKYSF
ncbi:MAG: hypothetical protein CMG27_01285 [Candidatus Marinimicrobia bacterium]|nr:hypothetical protein [Candidatus Neomarinimicrobiota bacterium]